jgi:hypothetical protein
MCRETLVNYSHFMQGFPLSPLPVESRGGLCVDASLVRMFAVAPGSQGVAAIGTAPEGSLSHSDTDYMQFHSCIT